MLKLFYFLSLPNNYRVSAEVLSYQWRIQSWSRGGGVSKSCTFKWLAKVSASKGVTT